MLHMNEQQQSPPHFQYPHEHGRGFHAPSLPSLAAAASSSSLPPPRLPQLPALARTVRSPQASSAGSSPATSPATTTAVGPNSSNSSMKRPMRSEHDHYASAAVYPSMMQLALASSTVSALSDDNDDDVKREDDTPATGANAVAKARKRRAVETDDDVFISGAYKAQRKPAPNATVRSIASLYVIAWLSAD